jgi:predicted solute-binding protein
MKCVRLGSVTYLNARPCVVGLHGHARFRLRFDLPSRCATLLHEGAIDVGLIPSIEYLRGHGSAAVYRIVPDIAIASLGPVRSVGLYTTRPLADVRSIAMDTSSRTSVALTQVLCARAFGIAPALEHSDPDLEAMLTRCDAALIIGDSALLLDPASAGPDRLEKIDLGDAWTKLTGLPFVYAFWAGRAGALSADDVRALQEARDAGVSRLEQVAGEYFDDPTLQGIGVRYLRDNIRYVFGEAERAGLEAFYRYAAELGLVGPGTLRFY